MEFVLPLKFENLSEQPTDNRYWVEDLISLEKWEESRQLKQLEKIIDDLFYTNERCLNIGNYFDILYSFIYSVEKLSPETQKKVSDIVVGGYQRLIQISEKDPNENNQFLDSYKMYLALLLGIFTKNKNFISTKCIELINDSLPIIKALYAPEKPNQRLLELIINIVLSEVEKGNDNHICDIMKWIKEQDQLEIWEGWRAKSVNILFGDSEKCIKPLVNIIQSEPSLLNEFLTSLSEGIMANDQVVNEGKGIKNVGTFLEKLSAKLQKEMLMNASIIVNLLNCESFSLRNSVVVSISEILVFIISKDKEQSVEKDTFTNYREQLLDILKSRVMDKSGFCRSKVLESFCTLTKESLLPRDWFMPTLIIASNRLLDCTALVRRKAMALLESLIYDNVMMQGDIKIESKESVQEKLSNHQARFSAFEQALDGNFDETTAGMDRDAIQQQLIKEQILVQYLSNYLDMTRIFQNSIKILLELLRSKNKTDITGSINVLVACSIRGICESNEAIAAMLSLVCNTDSDVRKQIQDAFYNVYLNKKFDTEEESLKKIFCMIETLNVGQLASLESLFAEMFTANKVSKEIKLKIWSKFKNEESYPAAVILRFLSVSEDKNFLERRYDTFANRTLELYKKWAIFRECLRTIQNLEYQGEKTDQFVYKSAHQLFEIKDSGWFPVAEQLIRTAAALSESPLVILKALAIKALKILTDGGSLEFDLAKAIFIGGEIAMKVVVYGDKVANEYKKNQIDSHKKTSELDEINGGQAAQLQMELRELKVAQENILFEGLLSQFTIIVNKLVAKLGEIKTKILQKALIITLAKFMCINPNFCKQNLELLLNVANSHENPDLRSSAIVGLGDLVMRHPNMLEENSSRIFNLLSDPEIKVRKKALLIISHLVLNDMLKMKGLMANILKCYLDKDLKGVVAVFIEELNQKGKTDIFNMIPDSISNLLKMELTHTDFKSIADMIFSYITLEKQGEGLCDNLSSKFKDTNKEESLNLGYCLTKLLINERALRKLLDNSSWWQYRLMDDNVLQGFFNEIAGKCRKNWKSEKKILIDEFEAAVRGEEEVCRKRRVRG